FTITAFTPGDVDDDGMILAYDAALTLQYSVGIDPLPVIDPLPWENWRDSTANVDATAGITANDAAMILQYSAGIIPDFSAGSKKSVSLANVNVEVVNDDIVFYSNGELLGLNISTTNENEILGTPEVLAEDFMSAFNISGSTFKIGPCTASSPSDGVAVMKIPFNKSGSVTFHMIVNTNESNVTVDLVTGLVETEDQQIAMYPNPVTDKLRICGLAGPAVARIYNVHGRMLISANTEGSTGEINVSDLPAGIYVIMLETNMETVVKKFSIK
ncbi:MAG: T9SS type A sorting domain-containing protein, partial [Bacteroidales bacterium]|nr:T9SS type A sorting domain-containing protein [Bacteroidales bacterium]